MSRIIMNASQTEFLPPFSCWENYSSSRTQSAWSGRTYLLLCENVDWTYASWGGERGVLNTVYDTRCGSPIIQDAVIEKIHITNALSPCIQTYHELVGRPSRSTRARRGALSFYVVKKNSLIVCDCNSFHTKTKLVCCKSHQSDTQSHSFVESSPSGKHIKILFVLTSKTNQTGQVSLIPLVFEHRCTLTQLTVESKLTE